MRKMNKKLKQILVLGSFYGLCSGVAEGQIVTEGFDVRTNEGKTTIGGKVEISGETDVNGDLVTDSRLYFGGGKVSSYVQHIDGGAAKQSSTYVDLPVRANSHVNVKVNVGGRAWWENGGAEKIIYGSMYPSGYFGEKSVFSNYPISISHEWISNTTLRIHIHNASTQNYLMFTGTATVSMHHYDL